MDNRTALHKKQIIKKLDKLQESDIQEILDFMEFVLKKRGKVRRIPSEKLVSYKDPILKFIGSTSVEPFSDKIDKELYGE